jgi:hypothetical protein
LDLFVAGRYIASEPAGKLLGEGPALPSVAAAINAAVEQREAKLVAALRNIDKLFAGAAEAPPDQFFEFNPEALRRMHKHVREALAGTGPEYVPASELHAEREKTRGTWMVLFDALHESGGVITPAHRQLMEALGLKAASESWPMTIKSATDDEVIAEMNRRGLARQVVAAGMRGAAAARAPYDEPFANRLNSVAALLAEHRCPHCNDMPYVASDGANRMCPQCGLFLPLTVTTDRTERP